MKNSSSAVQEFLASGKIDESNILEEKREKKKIDYIQLSMDVSAGDC
jgi:hypothetical protein